MSAVASVTLKKLVEPLKVINMDDHELDLMKEIVLFNPGKGEEGGEGREGREGRRAGGGEGTERSGKEVRGMRKRNYVKVKEGRNVLLACHTPIVTVPMGNASSFPHPQVAVLGDCPVA